jgi:hypothetical protein
MTDLINFIEEKVIGRVAISYTPKYEALTVGFEVEKPEDNTRTATRFRLMISWGSEVVCTTTAEKEMAKHRLIENFKYAIYSDILEHMHRLRTQLYNRDFYEAIKTLNHMEDEITYNAKRRTSTV